MIIIDGHNLIGKLPGLKLSDPNSKMELLNILDNYQNHKNNKIIVVFDGSTFGNYEREDYNNIEVRYPLEKETADDAIYQLINKYRMDKSVKIISSDNQIIKKAREAGLESEDCKTFINKLHCFKREIDENKDSNLSKSDISNWVNYFKS